MPIVSEIITRFEDNEIMTGKEIYPFKGDAELFKGYEKEFSQLVKNYKGLRRYWDCQYKNAMALKYIGNPGLQLVLGELSVFSLDGLSSFGYLYNPPLEFHAWISATRRKDDEEIVIDFALPGVIEMGLKTKHLTDMEPHYLLGKPPENILYKACIAIELEELKKWGLKFQASLN